MGTLGCELTFSHQWNRKPGLWVASRIPEPPPEANSPLKHFPGIPNAAWGHPQPAANVGPWQTVSTSAVALTLHSRNSSSVIGWRRADGRGSAVPGPGFPGSVRVEPRVAGRYLSGLQSCPDRDWCPARLNAGAGQGAPGASQGPGKARRRASRRAGPPEKATMPPKDGGPRSPPELADSAIGTRGGSCTAHTLHTPPWPCSRASTQGDADRLPVSHARPESAFESPLVSTAPWELVAPKVRGEGAAYRAQTLETQVKDLGPGPRPGSSRPWGARCRPSAHVQHFPPRLMGWTTVIS